MSGLSYPHRPLRGFTLIEVIVVVVIVSVLAVLAIPSISQRMQDRRVSQAAQQAADLYRTARMRAMGRGAAVLFRYSNVSSAAGRFELREAIMGPGAPAPACRSMPVTGCNRDWISTDPATDTNRLIGQLDLTLRGEFANTFVEAYAPDDTAITTLEVCFTPLGRTFFRTDTTQNFAPMVGVPSLRAHRKDSSNTKVGRERDVALLPSGAARMTSRVP